MPGVGGCEQTSKVVEWYVPTCPRDKTCKAKIASVRGKIYATESNSVIQEENTEHRGKKRVPHFPQSNKCGPVLMFKLA